MAIVFSRPHRDSDNCEMSHHAPHRDDDDASGSDIEEDVEELSSDEIPGYFQERGGRLFHSHGSSPYPLPVDAEEQQRQNGLNQLLRRLIGASFVGPVHDTLANVIGEQKRVLDLGTGTGQWVLDMARDFQHVRFYGIDIVPIATRYPPRNVQFEMHDFMQPFRFESSSIDMIHARSITMALRDYGALLPEIARVLRRGGLFVSCEWGRFPAMYDGSDVQRAAPRTFTFFEAVRETLQDRRGIQPIAPRIPDLLRQSGRFTDIVSHPYHMPVGQWHPRPDMQQLGFDYREMVALYARSMRTLLMESRWASQANDLIDGYIWETWHVPGLMSTLFTVHARRV